MSLLQMSNEMHYFARTQLQQLINSLVTHGYECIGPQIRDGAIVFEPLNTVAQLPEGIQDQQSPGHYRLTPTASNNYFGWANGPQAIKPYLFRPQETLWKASRNHQGEIAFSSANEEPGPVAIIGVRACDVAAMKLQDQHFLEQQFVDPFYRARREKLLLVAVNCGHPAETCFCHSTGDGPFVEQRDAAVVDIILTELEQGFLAQANTHIGESVLQSLNLQNSTEEQRAEAQQIKSNSSQQQRQLPATDIATTLMQRLEHNGWDDIARECLSCGNCTSVCPSCFCHSEDDNVSLDAGKVEHIREWDSCFTAGHSYVHGISIRVDTSQRYRQWLTHKFSSWHQQYGRSGCVGCGRCISWCPAAIDVTESIHRIVEVDE